MAANGPVNIVVCMGSSCFSRGNSANLAAIQHYIKTNGVDAQVKLAGSRCEGECLNGPNIRINGELVTGVNPENIPAILDSIFKEN